MTKQTTIKADLSQLEDMLKKLGGEFSVKIGIIGSAASETYPDSDATNAEVGLYNEFGTERIPPRSFLRMPLEMHQKDLVKAMGKGEAKERIKSGDVKGFYDALGLAALEIVDQSFPTGGYGSWEANAEITVKGGWMTSTSGKPFYVKGKKSSAPLIDTGQLRRSISYQVVKKSELR